MKNRSRTTHRSSQIVAIICLLLSNCIWAQSSHEPAKVMSAELTGSPSKADTASTGIKPATKGHNDDFVIGVDDVLAVNVWKEPEISRSLPVRSDGRISLPLVGEVTAAGETPKKLEGEIATKLQSYISEPEVTVIVQEIRSQKINILGQVSRPGSYALANTMTVVDAIAMAGGFRDFAKQKSIYVLRTTADGTQARLPFNYKEFIKGKNPGQNVTLEPRDTVVIP